MRASFLLPLPRGKHLLLPTSSMLTMSPLLLLLLPTSSMTLMSPLLLLPPSSMHAAHFPPAAAAAHIIHAAHVPLLLLLPTSPRANNVSPHLQLWVSLHDGSPLTEEPLTSFYLHLSVFNPRYFLEVT